MNQFLKIWIVASKIVDDIMQYGNFKTIGQKSPKSLDIYFPSIILEHQKPINRCMISNFSIRSILY